MKEILEWLEQWYLETQAEELSGYTAIIIETTDDPGWYVRICIESTEMEGKAFEEISMAMGHNDWVSCKIEGVFFKGYGSPGKLEYILKAFKDWVTGCS